MAAVTRPTGEQEEEVTGPSRSHLVRLRVAKRILAWGWSSSWSNGPRLMHWVGWEPGMRAAPAGLEGMSEQDFVS